ncbi:hypothetical protein ACLOJK_028433 [Asimina triloba]
MTSIGINGICSNNLQPMATMIYWRWRVTVKGQKNKNKKRKKWINGKTLKLATPTYTPSGKVSNAIDNPTSNALLLLMRLALPASGEKPWFIFVADGSLRFEKELERACFEERSLGSPRLGELFGGSSMVSIRQGVQSLVNAIKDVIAEDALDGVVENVVNLATMEADNLVHGDSAVVAIEFDQIVGYWTGDVGVPNSCGRKIGAMVVFKEGLGCRRRWWKPMAHYHHLLTFDTSYS